MVNLAALIGILRGIRMAEGQMWARTDRVACAPAMRAGR
jgi:hypothetical protein